MRTIELAIQHIFAKAMGNSADKQKSSPNVADKSKFSANNESLKKRRQSLKKQNSQHSEDDSSLSEKPRNSTTNSNELTTFSTSSNNNSTNNLKDAALSQTYSPPQSLNKDSSTSNSSVKKKTRVPKIEKITYQQKQLIRECWATTISNKLALRIYRRVFQKRLDIQLTYEVIKEALGEEHTWQEEAKLFGLFLQSLIDNLHMLSVVEQKCFEWGQNCVKLKEFGFKPAFWVPFSEAITTECLYLDRCQHSIGETVEAWTAFVNLMLSNMRDGYYTHLRSLRRETRSMSRQSSSGSNFNQSRIIAQNLRTSNSYSGSLYSEQILTNESSRDGVPNSNNIDELVQNLETLEASNENNLLVSINFPRRQASDQSTSSDMSSTTAEQQLPQQMATPFNNNNNLQIDESEYEELFRRHSSVQLETTQLNFKHKIVSSTSFSSSNQSKSLSINRLHQSQNRVGIGKVEDFSELPTYGYDPIGINDIT